MVTPLYDLFSEYVHTPNNDIEALVITIFAAAAFTLLLISVPYIITVIGQIFSRK